VDESFKIEIEFVTKMQLKGLTYMFYLLMSSYNVYKIDAFPLDFTLKIMCHLGWTQRSLAVKAKHKIKIFRCLVFLIHLLFYFPTYLLLSYLGS
jgi:hypothetical protein